MMRVRAGPPEVALWAISPRPDAGRFSLVAHAISGQIIVYIESTRFYEPLGRHATRRADAEV